VGGKFGAHLNIWGLGQSRHHSLEGRKEKDTKFAGVVGKLLSKQNVWREGNQGNVK